MSIKAIKIILPKLQNSDKKTKKLRVEELLERLKSHWGHVLLLEPFIYLKNHLFQADK